MHNVQFYYLYVVDLYHIAIEDTILVQLVETIDLVLLPNPLLQVYHRASHVLNDFPLIDVRLFELMLLGHANNKRKTINQFGINHQ